jgi:hypothetical protein
MKPTPQISQRHSATRDAHRSAMPKIDYSFRADSLDEYTPCGGHCAPSFRDISGEYFQDEAPRAFAAEAFVFGAIVLTVIVPLINSASAIMQLVRSFSL